MTAILSPICHHAPAVTAMPCHSILQLFLAFWFEGKESVLKRMFVCGLFESQHSETMNK